MKQVIILGHKDFEQKLYAVLKEVRIPMYSKFDIFGHRVTDQKDLLAWYNSQVDADYSIILMLFVDDDALVKKLMGEIRLLNQSKTVTRPFHAYALAVEQFAG